MEDLDRCEECMALGDDVYIDDDGELAWACEGCEHNRVEEVD